MDNFDTIIIGAGSAGCVLAGRLSADPRRRVLVLEAGGSDRHPWVRLPIGYGKTFHDPRVNWRFQTAPNPGLDGREIYWPRGKVVGGSGSINGLVYIRGLPGDFDDWRDAGNPGWGWDDLRPVFERTERHARSDGREEGEGPMRVAERTPDYHPLKAQYFAAAQELGLGQADADAPYWSEGVAPYRITTHRGLRWSAANAFLHPARRRPNLELRTGVHVERLVFDGARVVGVRYRRGARSEEVRAEAEVVLAAGAVQSPQILQLSGIGPGALLSGMAIPVIRDLPVGAGLQDHLGIDYLFRTDGPTLNQALGTWTGRIRAAWQFLAHRRGPLSLSVNQLGGMVRSGADVPRADAQLYCTPLSYSTSYRNKRALLKPDPWPGFAFGFSACRPHSTGEIHLTSPDPMDAPVIAPDYLSDPRDSAEALAAARLVERMIGTRAMQSAITGTNGFNPAGASDDAILADYRARATTVFHACGTCRMAPKDQGGVVDPALRVYGIDGLRVADASIFPNVTSANTNAPTIMVAQKAADIILGNAGGPP